MPERSWKVLPFRRE